MNMSDNSILEQLERLHENFRSQLPERIQVMDEAWRGLARTGWDIEAARRLRLHLHSLTGSAGTFGFSDVSSASREAEVKLHAIIETARPPASAQLLQMSELLSTVRVTASTEKSQPLTLPPKATDAVRNLIYLVDDDEGFALNTSLQLRAFGYEVQIFNGPETLKAGLRQKRPAAILVDIMFDGDVLGTTVMQELRGRMPEIPPFIFISVRDDFVARLGAARAGCSGYFTKPLDIPTLVDCLDYLTKAQPDELYRVLIVDDSPLDAAAHALHLQHAGFRTLVVTDPMAVTTKLAEFAPDLILMDLNMPECNGVDLASVIRQEGAYVGTPIVFLSAETDRDRQLSAMKNGGDDFLTKPVKPSQLAALVQVRAGRGRILRSHMVRDGLTGLLNNNRVREHLGAEVARAKRHKTNLAVAMIDIDHFKKINSTHGNTTGDRVIKGLARLLQQRLRTTDIIGRYAGKEFLAILIGTQADQALSIMDKIRTSFNSVNHRSKKEEFTSSFSCGIASFPEFSTPAQLLEAAEQALRKAKSMGRNFTVLAG
ncbi:MAG: diguanylate cyclase [Burkholderiales bacterium]|nr:diguanylate cyclase [Burkholderiales bacterium]